MEHQKSAKDQEKRPEALTLGRASALSSSFTLQFLGEPLSYFDLGSGDTLESDTMQ